MNRFFSLTLLALLWPASLLAANCGYEDDPRLSSEQVGELLQAIASGQPIEPVNMKIGTYLLLGDKSRELLEPHLAMQGADCKPVIAIDGELMGQASISFEEFYRTMAQAIHEDRPQVAKQLFNRVRVAPMNVEQIQELFAMLPYPGSYGIKVRDRMQEIFPQYLNTLPPDRELKNPLAEGRPQDYVMFRLFQLFGGTLQLEHGCGPYALSEKFYHTEFTTNILSGQVKLLSVRTEPFAHMMYSLGHSLTQDLENPILFHLKNCQ